MKRREFIALAAAGVSFPMLPKPKAEHVWTFGSGQTVTFSEAVEDYNIRIGRSNAGLISTSWPNDAADIQPLIPINIKAVAAK